MLKKSQRVFIDPVTEVIDRQDASDSVHKGTEGPLAFRRSVVSSIHGSRSPFGIGGHPGSPGLHLDLEEMENIAAVDDGHFTNGCAVSNWRLRDDPSIVPDNMFESIRSFCGGQVMGLQTLSVGHRGDCLGKHTPVYSVTLTFAEGCARGSNARSGKRECVLGGHVRDLC